ncbi:MAG: hypothetical protein R2748_22380 [Bryobacterales bacterium]
MRPIHRQAAEDAIVGAEVVIDAAEELVGLNRLVDRFARGKVERVRLAELRRGT